MNSPRKVLHKKGKKKTNFKKKFKKRLAKNLQQYLELSDATAKFIASITCGLITANAVWLKRLCQAMEHTIKTESQVRKLERFFKYQDIDYHRLSLMMYTMLRIAGKITLVIDRTNWDFGKKHINILVIAARCETPDGRRFVVPIAWEVFDKKGNSNSGERIDLLKRAIAIVGKENIDCIIGDREFIGEKWMQFLADENIPFIMRIRSNMYVTIHGKRVQVGTLVKSLNPHAKISLNVVLNNASMRLTATKTKDDEPVIVVSRGIDGDPLNEYRLRWLIELFFKSIKSKGFQLEDTHMTEPAKIKKLFALMAIATLYTIQAGIVRHVLIKKIEIKNHGRATYSLFTYGLDFLRDLFKGVASAVISTCNLLAAPQDDPQLLKVLMTNFAIAP